MEKRFESIDHILIVSVGKVLQYNILVSFAQKTDH